MSNTQPPQVKQFEQTYALTSMKQSVSINDSLKNFKAVFSITSLDKLPFYLAVVSDDTPTSQIKFQLIDKEFISGTLVNEKDVYKSYSLVLKADNPCNVKIQMVVSPLKDTKKSDNYINYLIFIIILVAVVLYMYGK